MPEVWGGRRRGRQATPSLTIADFVARYRHHVEVYNRKAGEPNSEVGVIRLACKRLVRVHGPELAADFTPGKLRAWREKSGTDTTFRGGLSRPTLHQLTNLIKRLFNWAVEEELVPAAASVRLPEVPAPG